MNNQNRELAQNAILYGAKPMSGYTGDFATLQEAIDAIPEGKTTPVTIYLRPGTYREAVRISGDKPYITLVGEGETPEEVCIAYDNYAGRKPVSYTHLDVYKRQPSPEPSRENRRS